MRTTRTLLVLCGLVLLAAGPASAQADAPVTMSGNAFAPKTITIVAGQAVVWTHAEPQERPHSVTADDGTFDSSPGCADSPADCMKTGDTFRRVFDAPGTFAYHCVIHGGAGGTGMSGTVVVTASAPTPPPPAAATPVVTAGAAATPTPPRTAAPTSDVYAVESPATDGAVTTTTSTGPAVEQAAGEPSPVALAAQAASDGDGGGGLALYLLGVGGLAAAFAGMLFAARRRGAA